MDFNIKRLKRSICYVIFAIASEVIHSLVDFTVTTWNQTYHINHSRHVLLTIITIAQGRVRMNTQVLTVCPRRLGGGYDINLYL